MPVGADGEFIDQVSAVRAWAQAAHEVLVATASRQRGAIDTATLARTVQQRTGIATKQSASKWIGPLLGVIAKHNAVTALSEFPQSCSLKFPRSRG